jgi:hypothetical protein
MEGMQERIHSKDDPVLVASMEGAVEVSTEAAASTVGAATEAGATDSSLEVINHGTRNYNDN